MKLTIKENTVDNFVRKDLMPTAEIKEAQQILKQYGFNGIEVATYTNEYTNLVTGPSIFIDVDAYTSFDIACIDFDYKSDLKFYLRFTGKSRGLRLTTEDANKLAAEFTALAACVDDLNAKVDINHLKHTLDMYYKGRV